jgi:cysteine synthase
LSVPIYISQLSAFQKVQVNDEPAYAMTKRLFREEGLIVGPSTGAMVHAAIEFGKRHSGLAVAISPDGGFKYTSYFREILGTEGLPQV